MENSSERLSCLNRFAYVLRLRGRLANDPRARILHILLLGVFGALVLYLAFGLHYSPRKPAAFVMATSYMAAIGADLFVLYRGSLRAASHIYLWATWVNFSILIVLNGGVRSAGDVFYVALPISAAWLLGRRAALLAAAGCAACWLIMAVLEFNGFPFPAYFPGAPLSSWAVLIIALVISAVPVAQVLENLRRALAAMRESEQRFRNLADTAPMLIWTSGPDRLCDFFNKRWLDFTGRSMEQELGHGWSEGVHPDDLEQCLRTSASAYESRTGFQMEYRLRRADGEYRWLLDTGVPRITPDGGVAGYIGSALDITDTKRAVDEAFDRQKMESLRLLTAGIAHDFKNLLGGIIANAESAAAEMSASAPGSEELQVIGATAIRASEIVRQLSIYSGEETGELARVNVSEVTGEMLRLTKTLLSKNAKLQLDLESAIPPVWADAAQVRQIVMNLVLNASEALGQGPGTICVRTSTGPNFDFVRLEVRDTGRGMTEHEKSKVFDPFFTTKSAGRGLGLAVVRGIVHSHGGKIEVSSALGQGTTFSVFLPAVNRKAEIACDVHEKVLAGDR